MVTLGRRGWSEGWKDFGAGDKVGVCLMGVTGSAV
jgi:hypothetical protein